MEKALKLKVDLMASSVVSGVPKKVPLLFGRQKITREKKVGGSGIPSHLNTYWGIS